MYEFALTSFGNKLINRIHLNYFHTLETSLSPLSYYVGMHVARVNSAHA